MSQSVSQLVSQCVTVGQKKHSTFLFTVSYLLSLAGFFLDILHERKKVTEPEFSGKLSFYKNGGKGPKNAQKGLKIGFLDLFGKLIH